MTLSGPFQFVHPGGINIPSHSALGSFLASQEAHSFWTGKVFPASKKARSRR